MKKLAFALVCAAIFAMAGCSRDEPETLSEEYPGEWRSDVPLDIKRALVSHGAKNCGYIEYKQRFDSSVQCLVYCSNDRKRWTAYVVWRGTDKVAGPFEQPSELQPPQ